jgi:hypothetical protein
VINIISGRRAESLSLIIAIRGVKPTAAMRRVCLKLTYLSAVIAFVTVLSGCEQQQTTADEDTKNGSNFRLSIGHPKNGDLQHSQFVDLRKPDGQAVLDEALRKLTPQQYTIHIKRNDGTFFENYHPSPTPGINTAKTTISEVAHSVATDASAANDPNATQHVKVQSPQQLEAVLAAFAEPWPTAAPTITP